jgi:hypothetical protein
MRARTRVFPADSSSAKKKRPRTPRSFSMWLSIRVSGIADDTDATDVRGTKRNVFPVPTACGGSDGCSASNGTPSAAAICPFTSSPVTGSLHSGRPCCILTRLMRPSFLRSSSASGPKPTSIVAGWTPSGAPAATFPSAAITTAVPTVGWPAYGISLMGTNVRCRYACDGSFGGRTNVDSE